MKKQTLGERLLDKLKKLGLPERKARELAKGLGPTVARQTVSGTVTGKLEGRLFRLGLSERKAKELAKALAPLVRSAIKAKVKAEVKTLDDVTDPEVDDVVNVVTDEAEDEELDKVAPRVNGHRVRLDLPVVSVAGKKAIELLRVMDGLTSTRTYLVAAVKSDVGIVAVRQLNDGWYRVKFYPSMEYWKRTPEGQAELGATDHITREWYERMHYTQEALAKLLRKLESEAKPMVRMKAIIDRFRSVALKSLIKAFDYLHNRVSKAA